MLQVLCQTIPCPRRLILFVSASQGDRLGVAKYALMTNPVMQDRLRLSYLCTHAWEPSLRKESGRACPPISSLIPGAITTDDVPAFAYFRRESLTPAAFSSASWDS
jgi:hypothetical protein